MWLGSLVPIKNDRNICEGIAPLSLSLSLSNIKLHLIVKL